MTIIIICIILFIVYIFWIKPFQNAAILLLGTVIQQEKDEAVKSAEKEATNKADWQHYFAKREAERQADAKLMEETSYIFGVKAWENESLESKIKYMTRKADGSYDARIKAEMERANNQLPVNEKPKQKLHSFENDELFLANWNRFMPDKFHSMDEYIRKYANGSK